MKTLRQLKESISDISEEMLGTTETEFDILGTESYEDWGEPLHEEVHKGKAVKLNKPFRTSDGKGKFAVYVKNDKDNIVKVNFGDTTGLTIKTDNPDRRRSFRARHQCDTNPGPKWKAKYWSCRAWSTDSVKTGLGI